MVDIRMITIMNLNPSRFESESELTTKSWSLLEVDSNGIYPRIGNINSTTHIYHRLGYSAVLAWTTVGNWTVWVSE